MYKFIALAFVLAIAGCGKDDNKKSAEIEKAPEPVVQAPVVQPEEVKPVEPPKPVQDKHFLTIDINKDGLKTGDVLEGYVDLSVPFENPFNSKDITVEAYINGESNGVSLNAPLYFESGNSEKSKWSLRHVLTKAGDYKLTINVRGKKKNYFSLESEFSVSKGEPSKVFKLSKKSFTHFENAAKQTFRAMGGDFPIQADFAKQKALLERMSKSGVNTIRICIEAPCAALVPEDTESSKAGWINVALFNKLESVMDAASELGIKTVICFASPLSFTEENYANSYFAKSNIAAEPKKFFSSFEAQQAFNVVLNYCALRFGGRSDLLMWQLIDGIDTFDMENFDARTMWLSNANVTLRDADNAAGHPLMLSAGTSSEMEFLWSGDSCDVLTFDIFDVRDFAMSVHSHNKFFSKKYKKPVGIGKFGYTKNAFVLPEPSNILVHNSIWAAEFTPSPTLPMANFGAGNDIFEASLNAIKGVSAFEKKFNISKADLELLNLREAIVLSAPKPAGNSISVNPAFGKTILERESSNDTAELIMEADGTVAKNTLPVVWKKEAMIALRINSLKNDKCVFSFDIVSIPQDDKFDLQISLNDELVKTEKISAEGVKQIREENGVKMAYLNKTVKIPLERGNQNIGVQMISSAPASMTVANIKVDGVGSNMGLASVKPYGMRDKQTGNAYVWFKRAASDSYSFAKYKLYERNVPELKSFEYSIQMKADTSYRVTWWDTRKGEEIAVGVVKSDPSGQLKLRTPPFKFDASCAIEVMP